MRFRRPSHSTVAAYLALFVALGGTSYALREVGSRNVTNNSLRSRDLRDNHAVTGRDVRDNRLTGEDIRERTLDATDLASVGHGLGTCDPAPTTFVQCASASIDLAQPSRTLVIAAGGFYSEGGPAESTCEVRIDGQPAGATTPGEVSTDNTDAGATDGFTVSAISGVLPSGQHSVSLACDQVAGDARISRPTVAAIAVGTRRGD